MVRVVEASIGAAPSSANKHETGILGKLPRNTSFPCSSIVQSEIEELSAVEAGAPVGPVVVGITEPAQMLMSVIVIFFL